MTVATLRQARRSAARSTADERVVVYITGEGLKTLDATREGFQMHEIEPTLESFEAESSWTGRR